MWAIDASGGGIAIDPSITHPRPINFGTHPGVSDVDKSDDLLSASVRMAVGGYGKAWGAEGALVFVPVGQSLLVAIAEGGPQGVSEEQRTLKRHFAKVSIAPIKS